jgi:N-methylhydantoinase A/oxoprolinase/acetone carboxylase beta subunit
MGPTIAGRIIGELGIGRILIPRDPGTFSAFGMLVTDVHQTRSFTRITRLDAAKAAELERIFAGMEEAAFADLMQEQFTREQLSTLRSAGMRYRGQSYEVSVAVTELNSAADLAMLGKRFHEAHRRRYGHMAERFRSRSSARSRPPKHCNRRYRMRRGRLTSMQPMRSKCRCSAAPRLRRARLSLDPPSSRKRPRPRCFIPASAPKSMAISTSPSPLPRMHDHRRFAASKRTAGCG